MPLKYSRFVVPRKAKDDALTGLLYRYGPLGFLEEGRNLVACFRSAGAAREAMAAAEAHGYRGSLSTDLPEGDPLEAFRAASRPFAVGRRLWIDPGDPGPAAPPASRVALRLPASRAFGTGDHESTRLALLALEDIVEPGTRVLDAGTGSGVLALAAAGLGAARAIGFDTDPDAVFVARENSRRHAFGASVAFYAGPVRACRGQFPIVLANMLPEELLPIFPDLLARLTPSGRLVLSGIPASREKQLLGRARARRLRLTARYREKEWSCLCLSRVSS